MDPSFIVPAEYFYALFAELPPQVTVDTRYRMATLEGEKQARDRLLSAIDGGLISAAPVPQFGGVAVSPAQAARRLAALGGITGNPEALVPPLIADDAHALVEHWLAYPTPPAPPLDDPADDIAPFWAGIFSSPGGPPAPGREADARGHLRLLMAAIALERDPSALIDGIDGATVLVLISGVPVNVTLTLVTVNDLRAILDDPTQLEALRQVFRETPALLPQLTLPGTVEERIAAFIRRVQQFLDVQDAGSSFQIVPTDAAPVFTPPSGDPLQQFLAAFPGFVIGGANDPAAVRAAAASVFPDDPRGQQWLIGAATALSDLFAVTALTGISDALHVSLMEALYARGFTSKSSILALTLADFSDALIGTVAHEHASAIYDLAGPAVAPGEPGAGSPAAVNPTGALVNCLPPDHLSPLGPTAYLSELLRLGQGSTCAQPFPTTERLSELVAARRGPLGALSVIRSNLETPLPLLDLVNESLEQLVATGSPGVVHDTASERLPSTAEGHLLRNPDAASESAEGHDPATLFAALPEHSSPATPGASLVAYGLGRLRDDLTGPELPYSQPLDVNRSYLERLGTSRFAVMRTFRKAITELALSPEPDPGSGAGAFRSEQWRYPVRLDIALEYLGVSPEEASKLFRATLSADDLRSLLGFPPGAPLPAALSLPAFLERLGLGYCDGAELIAAHREGLELFPRLGEVPLEPPRCEPCCPADYVVIVNDDEGTGGVEGSLKRLVVFVRLWHKLRSRGSRYSFAQLSDIADVLGLFDVNGDTNPDFIRQLAAFQLLRADFSLPLVDRTDAGTGTRDLRTHLLALWVGSSSPKWSWAIDQLVLGVRHHGREHFACKDRSPELLKLLADNLDALSLLAGFDPSDSSGATSWHGRPTHTLRFAEVLAKIYASRFGVGQIHFLFTADAHIGGDDPFPLPSINESLDSPLDLPDDDAAFSLWALRRKLLDLCVSDDDVGCWSWPAIDASLREEFGFVHEGSGEDPLTAFSEHFFPNIVAGHGAAGAAQRQYRVPLSGTSPLMWNTPPGGPFQYDTASEELFTELPLRDRAVLEKLSQLRPLGTEERQAVQDLYFLPRSELARFAFIFPSFMEADRHLIQEPDETARWLYFQRAFALAHARSHAIARHLAEHVDSVIGDCRAQAPKLAFQLLRALLADENKAKTPWESDDGARPEVTWAPLPSGGAFAALLGLLGTGLRGELYAHGSDSLVWREMRGPMDAFSAVQNAWNAPVPTVLPAMDLALSHEELRFAGIRNGFAIDNDTGERLNGAGGFSVTWRGVLLIEESGEYAFRAGTPSAEGEPPCDEASTERRWRVTLTRGQRSWVVLSHEWCERGWQPAHCAHLPLRRGAYDIVVELVQCPPTFEREDLEPTTTGFQLKYTGPDTCGQLVTLPAHRLFISFKDLSLDDGLDEGVALADPGSAKTFLSRLYVSSLRDIRRTYQRAFKAQLFARGLGLTVLPVADDGRSEIEFLLDHGARFSGLSFYFDGGYQPHLADLDFNFLPVGDTYHPPLAPLSVEDQRAVPSRERRQALFDWWERLFDYGVMRDSVCASTPAWFLFHDAAEQHPDIPAQLLRHLGVDLSYADISPLDAQPVLLEFEPGFSVTAEELIDERWALRVWRADRWLRALLVHFHAPDVRDARPALWAADDPSLGAPSGNENLTRFVQDGDFENGAPRRYEELKRLNDRLRERARAALVAYLTASGTTSPRATLPSGARVSSAKELSELLLIDVEAGLCQRASRIEEAISALQGFVQRARLGLEPGWQPSVDFLVLWDRCFANHRTWQAGKRRELYKESWIEYQELDAARASESFQLLEARLRQATLSVAAPAGLVTWDGPRPPAHPGVALLQASEPSVLGALPPPQVPPADGGSTREGFTLLGTPDRHARPSWLASPPLFPDLSSEKLPHWVEAAVRLGARFVRVAAAGLPMGSATYSGPAEVVAHACCTECGASHPPNVDEYYFWLLDSQEFESQKQDADVVFDLAGHAIDPQVQGAWHSQDNPDGPLGTPANALPSLLRWKSEPTVHLCWARVHNGELRQVRRSTKGVLVTSPSAADLVLVGRTADSLELDVTASVAPTGYQPAAAERTPAGFRYDLVTDSAEVLPSQPLGASAPPAPPTFLGGSLSAYPYFLFFREGAPLIPMSSFSQAMSVAGVLRSHCRFEAALGWYAAYFDPLAGDAAWCRVLAAEGESGVGCCNGAGSVEVHVARRRAVTLAHLETLLDWGDAVVRRHSPEAFQSARIIFDTAAKILGTAPRTVLAQVDSNAPVVTVESFTPEPAPLNPRLLALYERVSERQALIHACVNGRRLPNGSANRDMPYFGDVVVRNGWESTAQPCLDEAELCAPHCAYRFTFLIGKAIELANDVRALGAELLAAFEKGDTEYLTSLRTSHERQLAELNIAVRQSQWREADWQVQAAQKTKEIAQTRRRYTQGLIDAGLIGGELDFRELTQASTASRTAGNISEGIAQLMQLIPDLYVGFPISFTHLPIGTKLSGVFSAIARIANTVADIMGSTANLRLTEAGWDRRDADWRHQVEVFDLEIAQAERQILAAERRRDTALLELNNQQRQSEQSAEVLDFLRDKFTNHGLFLWLQRETASLHRQMYELAFQTARQAQRAFNYERGHTTRDFLDGEPWSDLREGLLAGERLLAALRRMEKAYLDENQREYELTKHISLRQLFPQQLLELKITGRCEIELPEWLFDLDYPGHYMRRIKNVSLTIPSVLGPFTGVHCRLTLLSSSTRIDPRLSLVAPCCPAPQPHPVTQACCHCGSGLRERAASFHATPENGYRPLPDDPRIVRQYGALEAIATSTAQNDSGLFEVSFRDERYLPFEFAGAVGRYRIELPGENNFFDVSTVADAVIHLRYTAREGGEVLRAAARAAASRRLPDAGQRLIDIQMELPDVWHRFASAPSDACRKLELPLDRDLFAFLPGQPDLRVTRVELLFAAPEAREESLCPPVAHAKSSRAQRNRKKARVKGAPSSEREGRARPDVEKRPPAHVEPGDRHREELERIAETSAGPLLGKEKPSVHPAAITVELRPLTSARRHDPKCPAPSKIVACAASAEWPGLYHGVADIELGPIGVRCEPAVLGVDFPAHAGPIERLFVLCVYESKATLLHRAYDRAEGAQGAAE